MIRKLEIAEQRIAELEAQLIGKEDDIRQLQQDVQYYRGIARQNEQVLKETGLDVWFSGNPDEVGDAITQITARFQRGEHMEMFEKLNKEHPILNSAWDKYMMALRLVGLDGTNDPDNFENSENN